MKGNITTKTGFNKNEKLGRYSAIAIEYRSDDVTSFFEIMGYDVIFL